MIVLAAAGAALGGCGQQPGWEQFTSRASDAQARQVLAGAEPLSLAPGPVASAGGALPVGAMPPAPTDEGLEHPRPAMIAAHVGGDIMVLSPEEERARRRQRADLAKLMSTGPASPQSAAARAAATLTAPAPPTPAPSTPGAPQP